ncbi:MAG: phage late control D family protein, partial [Blastocatellia bacterium]|nr:phage late control D family protein [Blastocatellia bacterium]
MKIDTILGQQQDAHDRGPLLLAAVQGIEGISMPFAYDVTMYRHMEDGDIDPTKMISTPVTIGMRGKTNEYTYRSGVFQTFQKAGTNEQNWEKGFQTDFRVFNARIVPAFKMLDYEIRYRVFEDKTVLEIIQEVMEGFPKLINFQSYVSTGLLKSDDYKKIPYCVQFGETSLNFLSRLMAEFDIWYVFDHRQSDIKSSNETMVLGSSFALFQQCTRMDMDVVFSAPDTDEIGGFQRSFVPARKRVWVSDFNMLNPAHVPRGSATTTGLYDMLPRETDPTSFEREIFPALLTDPSDSDDAMSEQAKSRVEDEEDGVFTVQGQCKNPSFMAGRIFHIRNDKTEPNLGNTGVPAGNNYLITQMSFAAFENAYGHYFYQDVGNWLLSPLRWVWSLFRKESLQQALYLDATAALA